MSQLLLDFDALPLQPRFAQFVEFHRQHPEVFSLFRRFAGEAKRAGRPRFSAHCIGERIRWYTTVETQCEDGLKLNDHHLPYYARLLMLTDERFDGFFERRDGRFDATDDEILSFCKGGEA